MQPGASNNGGFAKPQIPGQSRPKPPVPSFSPSKNATSKPLVPTFAAPLPPPSKQTPTVPAFESTSPSPTQNSPAPVVTATPHSFAPPPDAAFPTVPVWFEVMRRGVELPSLPLCDAVPRMYPHMAELAQRVRKYHAEEEYLVSVSDLSHWRRTAIAAPPFPLPAEGPVNALYSVLRAADAAGIDARTEAPLDPSASGPAEPLPQATLSGLPYVTLGRLPVAAVQVDHPSVSRIHAAISFQDAPARVWLHDLSTHGVRVNKARVPSATPTELFDGDLVVLGESSLTFVLRCDACTRPEQSRPAAGDGMEEARARKQEKALNAALVLGRLASQREGAAAALSGQPALLETYGVGLGAGGELTVRDAEAEEWLFEKWCAWEPSAEAQTVVSAREVGRRRSPGALEAVLEHIGKTDRQRDLIAKVEQLGRRVAELEERDTPRMGRVRMAGVPASQSDKAAATLEKAVDQHSAAEDALMASFRAKTGGDSHPAAGGPRPRQDDDDDDDIFDRSKRSCHSRTTVGGGFAALLSGARGSNGNADVPVEIRTAVSDAEFAIHGDFSALASSMSPAVLSSIRDFTAKLTDGKEISTTLSTSTSKAILCVAAYKHLVTLLPMLGSARDMILSSHAPIPRLNTYNDAQSALSSFGKAAGAFVLIGNEVYENQKTKKPSDFMKSMVEEFWRIFDDVKVIYSIIQILLKSA